MYQQEIESYKCQHSCKPVHQKETPHFRGSGRIEILLKAHNNYVVLLLTCGNQVHLLYFFWYIVHGGWGSWSTLTTCSVSCGSGVQSRSRICDNPAPSNGGRQCAGSPKETTSCNTNKPCAGTISVRYIGYFKSRNFHDFANFWSLLENVFTKIVLKRSPAKY